MQKDIFISIIVPAYNAINSIKLCAQSLLLQNYPVFEIIFVDDGSLDGTKEYLEELASYHNHLIRVYSIQHGGPAAARNAGITRAKGEVIFFTDTDVIVPPNWVSSMVRIFSDPAVNVVGGATKAYKPSTECERFEEYRMIRLYGTTSGERDVLPTCNLAIRHVVFDVSGMFDDDFNTAAGEDYELCMRIRRYGFKIIYEPAIQVYHMNVKTLKGLFLKAFRYGRAEQLWHHKSKYPYWKRLACLAKNIFFDIIYQALSTPLPYKASAISYSIGLCAGRIISYIRR